jgi:hypothetical protein
LRSESRLSSATMRLRLMDSRFTVAIVVSKLSIGSM